MTYTSRTKNRTLDQSIINLRWIPVWIRVFSTAIQRCKLVHCIHLVPLQHEAGICCTLRSSCLQSVNQLIRRSCLAEVLLSELFLVAFRDDLAEAFRWDAFGASHLVDQCDQVDSFIDEAVLGEILSVCLWDGIIVEIGFAMRHLWVVIRSSRVLFLDGVLDDRLEDGDLRSRDNSMVILVSCLGFCVCRFVLLLGVLVLTEPGQGSFEHFLGVFEHS